MTALIVGMVGATQVAADDEPVQVRVVVVEKKVQKKSVLWWSRRAVQARKDANARGRTIKRLKKTLESIRPTPPAVIDMVFGQFGSAARAVAWCESRYYTGASNGQYRGLFQMGSGERARYGHGSSAYEQALAAKRYFDASGQDWSPWECKP